MEKPKDVETVHESRQIEFCDFQKLSDEDL